MSIDFHCPFCNVTIKAPDKTGGKKGKCPKCKQTVYIPQPQAELDEFDLAPLDEEEERQRQQLRQEAVDIQREAYGEKSDTLEDPAPKIRLSDHVEDVPSMVIKYLVAMSQSKLEDSERIAEKLSEHKKPTVKYIKKLSADDSRPDALADIPEPLIQGFLKTLRNQL